MLAQATLADSAPGCIRPYAGCYPAHVCYRCLLRDEGEDAREVVIADDYAVLDRDGRLRRTSQYYWGLLARLRQGHHRLLSPLCVKERVDGGELVLVGGQVGLAAANLGPLFVELDCAQN